MIKKLRFERASTRKPDFELTDVDGKEYPVKGIQLCAGKVAEWFPKIAKAKVLEFHISRIPDVEAVHISHSNGQLRADGLHCSFWSALHKWMCRNLPADVWVKCTWD